MRLLERFFAVVDAILSRWPAAMGGRHIRLVFWKRRFHRCGKAFFGDRLVIQGHPLIEIGEGTSFMSNSYLYANGGGYIKIGDHCSFSHNVFVGVSGGEIVIGDDVLVGPNTVLRADDHEFVNCDTPIRLQGHSQGKIAIGNNVWLAANVVVTSGVSIGDGCVVGAGSVVTRDLPPMSVCFGNPARLVRSRLPDTRNQ